MSSEKCTLYCYCWHAISCCFMSSQEKNNFFLFTVKSWLYENIIKCQLKLCYTSFISIFFIFSHLIRIIRNIAKCLQMIICKCKDIFIIQILYSNFFKFLSVIYKLRTTDIFSEMIIIHHHQFSKYSSNYFFLPLLKCLTALFKMLCIFCVFMTCCELIWRRGEHLIYFVAVLFLYEINVLLNAKNCLKHFVMMENDRG